MRGERLHSHRIFTLELPHERIKLWFFLCRDTIFKIFVISVRTSFSVRGRFCVL